MVLGIFVDSHAGHSEALKNHHAFHFFSHDIEREQRVSKVIVDAHEKDQIESFLSVREVVNLHLTKIDRLLQLELPGSPPRLPQIMGIDIDPHHVRATERQFE